MFRPRETSRRPGYRDESCLSIRQSPSESPSSAERGRILVTSRWAAIAFRYATSFWAERDLRWMKDEGNCARDARLFRGLRPTAASRRTLRAYESPLVPLTNQPETARVYSGILSCASPPIHLPLLPSSGALCVAVLHFGQQGICERDLFLVVLFVLSMKERANFAVGTQLFLHLAFDRPRRYLLWITNWFSSIIRSNFFLLFC